MSLPAAGRAHVRAGPRDTAPDLGGDPEGAQVREAMHHHYKACAAAATLALE